MSTELKTIETITQNVTLTSYFGGQNRGICLQVTNQSDKGYIQLTKTQARELVGEINKWLIGDYSSSGDFVVSDNKKLNEFTD